MRTDSILVLDQQVAQARFDMVGVWVAQAERKGLHLDAIVWGPAAGLPPYLTGIAAILRFSDAPREGA